MSQEFRATQNATELISPLRIPVDRPGMVNIYAWPAGDSAHIQAFFNPDFTPVDCPADAQLTIKEFL